VAGWAVKANDGVVVVRIDDVVAGVENAKREEAGADAVVDVVVTAGVGAKENGDGAAAAVVVVEGVANANREPDGATVVAEFVFAGAPASEKRDED